jgi:hypothetical protein
MSASRKAAKAKRFISQGEMKLPAIKQKEARERCAKAHLKI